MAEKSIWPSAVFRWFFVLSEIWLFRAISGDNFAFMSGYLRTFQVHANDGKELNISCLEHTVINLQYAQYGALQPCVKRTQQLAEDGDRNFSSSLLPGNSLKVIEKTCREQRVCRLLASPRTFQEDPCPGVAKFAEVAYRCRPTEFVNKVVCENKKLELSCSYSQMRILVYSANFGTSVNGIPECPNTANNSEECQSHNISAEIMKSCNGHQFCSVLASKENFGKPDCSPSTHLYLKVIFTCVPKGILKTQLPDGSEYQTESSSESERMRNRDNENDIFHESLNISSKGHTSSKQIEVGSTLLPSNNAANKTTDRRIVVLIVEGISAYKFMAGNQTKLILYTSVSVSVGFLFFIAVVILHICLCGTKSRSQFEVPVITDDEDFFSDSDLEHFEGLAPAPAPPTVGTSDRKISESLPLTPIQGSSNNDYFS